MPEVAYRSDPVEPQDVFRGGGAFCPDHDTLVVLRGVDSGSSLGDQYIRVRMFCPTGRHWILATFETTPNGLAFRLQKGERETEGSF